MELGTLSIASLVLVYLHASLVLAINVSSFDLWISGERGLRWTFRDETNRLRSSMTFGTPTHGFPVCSDAPTHMEAAGSSPLDVVVDFRIVSVREVFCSYVHDYLLYQSWLDIVFLFESR